MSALTEPKNVSELACNAENFYREREIASGAKIYAGGIVCQNSGGKAYAGSTASGGIVLGIAENNGAAGDTVRIRTGVFLLNNDTTSAVTVTDIGSSCYVVDDATVAKAASNSIKAGTVLEVGSEGVAVRIG